MNNEFFKKETHLRRVVREMNKLELMDYFFHPKNVTLVGVSRKLMGVSSMLLMSLLQKNFQGDIHLINKNITDGKKIMGHW